MHLVAVVVAAHVVAVAANDRIGGWLNGTQPRSREGVSVLRARILSRVYSH